MENKVCNFRALSVVVDLGTLFDIKLFDVPTVCLEKQAENSVDRMQFMRCLCE
jgi:hypothetical protein